MAKKKGNKIRITVEMPTSANIVEVKTNILTEIQKDYPDLISLRADVSEVVVEPEKGAEE